MVSVFLHAHLEWAIGALDQEPHAALQRGQHKAESGEPGACPLHGVKGQDLPIDGWTCANLIQLIGHLGAATAALSAISGDHETARP